MDRIRVSLGKRNPFCSAHNLFANNEEERQPGEPGAAISQATDSGNFRLLLAGTILMASVVVTVNRTVWRPLYGLAEKRFRLES